ncbi:uncharacterized protein [Periplaneta americana]|uniref:uncharacterized protein n=1 Tax=Periplaneta americana TaxID=6978 RepID=UPI0037E8865F
MSRRLWDACRGRSRRATPSQESSSTRLHSSRTSNLSKWERELLSDSEASLSSSWSSIKEASSNRCNSSFSSWEDELLSDSEASLSSSWSSIKENDEKGYLFLVQKVVAHPSGREKMLIQEVDLFFGTVHICELRRMVKFVNGIWEHILVEEKILETQLLAAVIDAIALNLAKSCEEWDFAISEDRVMKVIRVC